MSDKENIHYKFGEAIGIIWSLIKFNDRYSRKRAIEFVEKNSVVVTFDEKDKELTDKRASV